MSVTEVKAAEDEPPFAAKQREVQRKLGRCLIQLQRLEVLAKALWVHHEFESEDRDFMAARSKREAHISDKTLGAVVKKLVDTYLVPDLGKPDEDSPNGDHSDVDPARTLFRFKSKFSMSSGDYSRVSSELSALVEMRNTLVHHFIERFDLWSDEGCEDAQANLDDCYQRIDALYSTISLWAEADQAAREELGAFLQSDEGKKAVRDLMTSDDYLGWSSTLVVTALRAAEEELSRGGWTSLEDAVRWLSANHPDEKPGKYGCSTWRHLLHESRLFEIQKATADGANGRRFRSLP